MKKKNTEIIHKTQGFTLVETLMVLLILLMVTSIVAAGIPSARNAYEKVVLSSNADVLLSTTASVLRNELGTAMDVKKQDTEEPVVSPAKVKKETSIVYFNPTRGSSSRIYIDNSGTKPEIMLQRYYNEEGLSASYSPAPLISASKADMYVTYDTVSYTDGVVTFTKLSVKQETKELAKIDQLSVRVITP